MTASERILTGIPEMDTVFNYLRSGDNVVWQTTDPEDLIPFAEHFAHQAIRDRHPFVYVRFAGHESLVSEAEGIRVLAFDLDHKFEDFTVRLYNLIKNSPADTCYLFDSLSRLQTGQTC